MPFTMLISMSSLLDRLIQLVTRREALNRSHYADFIAPMMVDLDAVHKDYIESFRRYQELLRDTSHPITMQHPIFEAMDNDNALSAGLREKVICAWSSDPPDSDLAEFSFAISHYLYGINPSPHTTVEIQNILIRFDFPHVIFPVVRLLTALKASLENEERSLVQQNRSSTALCLISICDHDFPDEKRRRLAKLVLIASIDKLQRRYRRVVGLHNQLKRKLLQPF
jgi:hypothetical protein